MINLFGYSSIKNEIEKKKRDLIDVFPRVQHLRSLEVATPS